MSNFGTAMAFTFAYWILAIIWAFFWQYDPPIVFELRLLIAVVFYAAPLTILIWAGAVVAHFTRPLLSPYKFSGLGLLLSAAYVLLVVSFRV
jgi:hypothetical protein